MMIKVFKSISIFSMVIVVAMIFGITAKAEEIDNTVQYTVSEGCVYWESPEQWGTGRHNTVCNENRYTNTNCGKLTVWIDGYSVIEQNGDIVETYFEEKVQTLNIPATTRKQELMVHIWGTGESSYRLGWIKFSEVNCKEDKSDNSISEIPDCKEDKSDNSISEIPEGNEQEWFENSQEKTEEGTVDTLRGQIEEDAEIPRNSYIFADFSGSMYEFQLDVLEKLEGTSGKKYVFAEDIEEFVLRKDTGEYNIGSSTNIVNALNKVDMEYDSHIYILSDLNDNCGASFVLNEKFVGEITIVYYPEDYNFAMDFMELMKDAYPNAIITGF